MFPGFHIGKAFLSSYAICVIVGIFAAFPLAIRSYVKRRGDDVSMILALLFAGLGAFLGMHLLFGITNITKWYILTEAEGFIDFLKRFAAIFGGSVFYGGLLGGLLGGGISIKVQKLDAGLAADCLAPSIALFHCFGRIGCFLSGCCFGVESEHGITFTHSMAEMANGVPRVPVQLYEAAFELALFAVLRLLLVKVRPCDGSEGKPLSGKLLLVYLITYSTGRFILEFWRGDDYRGFLFGLSTSQLISIAVFVVSAAIFVFKPKKAERTLDL